MQSGTLRANLRTELSEVPSLVFRVRGGLSVVVGCVHGKQELTLMV